MHTEITDQIWCVIERWQEECAASLKETYIVPDKSPAKIKSTVENRMSLSERTLMLLDLKSEDLTGDIIFKAISSQELNGKFTNNSKSDSQTSESRSVEGMEKKELDKINKKDKTTDAGEKSLSVSARASKCTTKTHSILSNGMDANIKDGSIINGNKTGGESAESEKHQQDKTVNGRSPEGGAPKADTKRISGSSTCSSGSTHSVVETWTQNPQHSSKLLKVVTDCDQINSTAKRKKSENKSGDRGKQSKAVMSQFLSSTPNDSELV